MPSCVNPQHLFVATSQENFADMRLKNRHSTARGEHSARAKLTASQVREILAAVRQQIAYTEIARRFAISHWTVSSIVRGKTWRHIRAPRPYTPRQKLTDTQVLELRRLFHEQDVPARDVAIRFGIRPKTAYHIAMGDKRRTAPQVASPRRKLYRNRPVPLETQQQICDIARMWTGSQRQLARRLGIGRTSVARILRAHKERR
jgi:DNA-binding CsgD family transcriptional regulator